MAADFAVVGRRRSDWQPCADRRAMANTATGEVISQGEYESRFGPDSALPPAIQHALSAHRGRTGAAETLERLSRFVRDLEALLPPAEPPRSLQALWIEIAKAVRRGV
jgi:hypothetical protein